MPCCGGILLGERLAAHLPAPLDPAAAQAACCCLKLPPLRSLQYNAYGWLTLLDEETPACAVAALFDDGAYLDTYLEERFTRLCSKAAA